MKILITGAAGFIGHCFGQFLLKHGHHVYGIDNINSYYSRNLKLERIKNLKKNKLFKFKKIDLRNEKDLKKFLDQNKFDYIYHFAAQPGVTFSITNPKKYFDDNILAYFNLLNCLKKFNKTKIFYASSSSVYGDSEKYPVKESAKRRPKNFYGLSKKINEDIAELFSLNFKLKIIGLRFFTVFGEWGRPDMLLIKFFQYAQLKKTFFINNMGNHYRDFSYIEDVNKILYQLLKKEKFNKHKVYNICPGKPLQLKKIINLLSKITNFKKIKKRKLNQIEVLKTYGDNVLLKKTIGNFETSNFKESVHKTYNWYLKYKKII
jgi:UDP-glucuronate 4-epimerase